MMERNKGQTLIEFLIIGALVVGIFVFALFQFGDNLAAFFEKSAPEDKFNASRTEWTEDTDYIASKSNSEQTSENLSASPEEIKKLVKEDQAANSSYIQTSGSSAVISEIAEAVQDYINQIEGIVNTIGDQELGNQFIGELNEFKGVFDPVSVEQQQQNYSEEDTLEQKAELMGLSFTFNREPVVEDLIASYNSYMKTVPEGGEKREIESVTQKIIKHSTAVEYSVEPGVYTRVLNEEMDSNNPNQDKELINTILETYESMSDKEINQLSELINITVHK